MGSTLALVDFSDSKQSLQKFTRRLGGKPLVEWVVRQITDCQLIDRVAVTTKARADQSLLQLVPADVSIVRSQRSSVAGRCLEALTAQNCDSVVRIVCEGPFLDPLWVDRLVAVADTGLDYVTYGCSEGMPSLLKSAGFFAEWCSARVLSEAEREASLPDERAEIARFLFARREKYNICLLPVPAELNRDDVRVKVHTEEDWDHAQVLFEAIGHDDLSWPRIAELLDHQPGLRKRMAVLNRQETGASGGK